ncbi:MAG: fructosamine kinase family protein [Rhodospirillales bacterium]|nr:fructosamine kinase family protein [Rhodospirillales bacterium]
MTLPAAARARIESALGAPVAAAASLGGGCIADAWRIELAGGGAFVAKLGRHLAIEGWMLDWLKAHAPVPVPAVRYAADDLLVMDHIEHGGELDRSAEEHLGEIIAGLHGVAGDVFGFARDTVIGGLPQTNIPAPTWLAFFRDRRLIAMARLALDAGQLPARLMARIEKLGGRLDRLIAAGTTPALVHGDLWGGNILAHRGRIVGLIDPAIYFGDAEMDLAFITLFGSAGERFFQSYAAHRPIRAGFFEERRDLYNLYPLLVHVRLFGGSYVGDVARILDRFGV